MKTEKKPYWEPGELIVIGTFAGLIKISVLMIALSGGGMNPVTLVLKNVVATSLLMILVVKVNKFGVLTLYALISCLVSLILMGGKPVTIVGVMVAGILCDLCMGLAKNRKSLWVLIPGIGLFDLLSRIVSFGYMYFIYQEQIKMFIMGTIIVSLGYLGCLIGLGTGVVFVKELRHAGIIRE